MNERLITPGERVAWWSAICARKPEAPGTSPAATYSQRWAPVNRECS